MSFQNRETRYLESLTAQQDFLLRSLFTVGNDEQSVRVFSRVIPELRDEVSGISVVVVKSKKVASGNLFHN